MYETCTIYTETSRFQRLQVYIQLNQKLLYKQEAAQVVPKLLRIVASMYLSSLLNSSVRHLATRINCEPSSVHISLST